MWKVLVILHHTTQVQQKKELKEGVFSGGECSAKCVAMFSKQVSHHNKIVVGSRNDGQHDYLKIISCLPTLQELQSRTSDYNVHICTCIVSYQTPPPN